MPRAQSPRLWPSWVGLLAYSVALALLAELWPDPLAESEPLLAPVTRSASRLIRDGALAAFSDLRRFVPLGFLAVLALPRRAGRLDRLFGVFLPALALALALSAGVVGCQLGDPWALPGVFDLVLPLLGCLLGCGLGLAWTKGRGALLWFVPKLALVLALAALGGAGLLYLAAADVPLDFEPTGVTAAEKRRLYGIFKDKHPARVPDGQTARLRLGERDLDLLLAWGLSLGGPGRKARVQLGPDSSTLSVSLRLPRARPARYLNLIATGDVRVEEGRPIVHPQRLAVGRLEPPRWLLELASPLAVRALAGDRRVEPVLAPIRSLETQRAALLVRYARAEPPPGFLAELFRGERADADDLPAIQTQLRQLVRASRTLPKEGDARFRGCVEAAFRLAQERSRTGDAVRENRAAILALGMLLGHWRVETLVGRVTDAATMQKAVHALKGATLRGRDDWTKHFFVSASLTVLALDELSDAAGLLKEEIDSGGGSGFSFGDLLADRAGTAFAVAATRDAEAARAFQARLALGVSVDDVFPPAEGLPESIQDAELQARYGGVGGEGYRRLSNEIERRIRACAAYRL